MRTVASDATVRITLRLAYVLANAGFWQFAGDAINGLTCKARCGRIIVVMTTGPATCPNTAPFECGDYARIENGV
jgi:hypothetical protein